MGRKWNLLLVLAFITLMFSVSYSTTRAQEPTDGAVATVSIGPNEIVWQPRSGSQGLLLMVSGPGGFYIQEEFSPGRFPVFTLRDGNSTPRPDGAYTYELKTVTYVDDQVRQILSSVTEADRFAVEEQLRQAGKLPEAMSQSGSFYIAGGTIISNDLDELGSAGIVASPADQVISDDLVVQSSICVGMDCVNSENFGFDTFRLKENNLRIHFEDTSNSGSFPANDWRIIANDSSNGGASYLAVEDSTAGRKVFTVEAGASANALVVDGSKGYLGRGTDAPVVDVHTVNGNTPAVRLEQNGSSGFTSQTWDMGGNEANFFIRDVTNGSKLSFRIKPRAPENSLFIDTDGDIGLNTSSPEAALHLRRTDGTALLHIQDSNVATNQTLLLLEAAGAVRTEFKDTASDHVWRFRFANDRFTIQDSSDGGANYAARLHLDSAGNLQATSYADMSDVHSKENFSPVNGEEILRNLAEIPITIWNYKNQDETVRHIGPTAQDFHAMFGVGIDDRHIAPLDTNGVALAAIQTLNLKVEEKDQQINLLEAKNAELEARLVSLEQGQTSGKYGAAGILADSSTWSLLLSILAVLLVIGFQIKKAKVSQIRR